MKFVCRIVTLVLLLTACTPVGTTAPVTISVTSTKIPPVSATASVVTSTITPADAQGIDLTETPAPTSTAIATLHPGQAVAFASIHMSDVQNGWGIDVTENILHTVDGGQTWKDVTPRNGGYRISGFFALNADTAWATPYQQGCSTEQWAPEPNNATVWHTSDGKALPTRYQRSG